MILDERGAGGEEKETIEYLKCLNIDSKKYYL